MPPTNELSLLGKDDGPAVPHRHLRGGQDSEPRSRTPSRPFRAPVITGGSPSSPTPCPTHRYIGLHWGLPGICKTLSARHYVGVGDWAQWQSTVADTVGPVPPRVLEARTAFCTPRAATIKQID